MHRKLIDHIIDHGTSDNMHTLRKLVCRMVDRMKTLDHDEYENIEYELYKIAHGNHLNEELAREWVSKMVNKDGTHGEHWSMEQTQQYNDRHDKYEWYAIMNMKYSDHYNSKFTTNDYVELAKDWFNDPDANECKTLKYYMLVIR